MNDYYLAVFDSTHHAMRFEKVVKDGGFKINIMPVPREITASCGLSVKMDRTDYDDIRVLADNEKLIVKGYYLVETQNNKKTYHKSI
ncbi:MAG: DUF3343 domain-containing protein [Caulobacteraceae bacterium]